MTHHDLKCWPVYFHPVWDGIKSFEIRKNDREFAAGDTITLMEYVPETKSFTGREIFARIEYVTKFCQTQGYVVFSFSKTGVKE
jgi:hypothetical protein